MVLAATGLKREAAALTRVGLRQRPLHRSWLQVVAGGGDSARLARELAAAAPSCAGVISIGLGGALASDLKPGDWVVGTRVVHGLATPIIVGSVDEAWSAALVGLLPGARAAPVYASNAMLADPAAKARAREVTGAAIVDMESHIAALVAARFGLPFAVARVVSDGADRALPPAAQAGMAADGRVDVAAVLKALTADPRQLPALIQVGVEAGRAFKALDRGLDLLGVGLGLPNFRQLPLDVS